jgi:glycosyltransferase involved in cell wall biosynthesis
MRQERSLGGWDGRAESALPKLSIIVPVFNGAATLRACLEALIEAPGPSREILVSDDGSQDNSVEIASSMGVSIIRSEVNRGVGAARNAAASRARAPILVFVDCDAVIHRDALNRMAAFLEVNPQFSAVFGSYDTKPTAPNFVSQYRNLLHHFTHQNGRFEAETLWTGLGAIRRSVFEHAEGFCEARPCLEDVELGLRLSSEGFRIALVPSLNCTHLKAWTLIGMAKTDLFSRALPWSTLLLERRRLTSDLNTNGNGRVGVASISLAATSLPLAAAWPGFGLVTLAVMALLMLSMQPLLQFFCRERGVLFAARCVPCHFIHLLCASAGFLMALLHYLSHGLRVPRRRRNWSRSKNSRVAPSVVQTGNEIAG